MLEGRRFCLASIRYRDNHPKRSSPGLCGRLYRFVHTHDTYFNLVPDLDTVPEITRDGGIAVRRSNRKSSKFVLLHVTRSASGDSTEQVSVRLLLLCCGDVLS